MIMLRRYSSLVRSKLDQGCIVYGSARKFYLHMLHSIHNQGLGAVESLYVDTHEPCLGARRAKLSLHYVSKKTKIRWVTGWELCGLCYNLSIIKALEQMHRNI